MRLTLLLACSLTLTAADAGPRPGKYNCYSYGATGKPPILITSIEMKSGGEYEQVFVINIIVDCDQALFDRVPC